MASWSGLTMTCLFQKRKFITFFANYIQRYILLGLGFVVQVGLFDQAKHIVNM